MLTDAANCYGWQALDTTMLYETEQKVGVSCVDVSHWHFQLEAMSFEEHLMTSLAYHGAYDWLRLSQDLGHEKVPVPSALKDFIAQVFSENGTALE